MSETRGEMTDRSGLRGFLEGGGGEAGKGQEGCVARLSRERERGGNSREEEEGKGKRNAPTVVPGESKAGSW